MTVVTPAPGGGTSNSVTFTISAPANPVPTLTSLAPTSTAGRGAGFTLTVNGSNFVGTSEVRWNGARADDDVCECGPADGGDSGERHRHAGERAGDGGDAGARRGDLERLDVHHQRGGEPGAGAHVAGPDEHGGRGAGFTLTVNGSNFVGTSEVRWNGAARTTTFVNAGQVTAAIPASDIVTQGSVPVTVVTPAPGGGTSNSRDVHHQRAGEPGAGAHLARPDEHAGRGGRVHADREREQFRRDLPSPLERRRADDDVCERGPGDGGDSGERHRHPGERAGDGGDSGARRGDLERAHVYDHRRVPSRGILRPVLRQPDAEAVFLP